MLAVADGRDATHWGLTFLDLAQQGVVFHDVAADGARRIQAGLRDTQLNLPLRPDLFHLLREANRLQNYLDKAVYKANGVAERAKRATQEASQSRRRKGRPLNVSLAAGEAAQIEYQAIETYDNLCFLMSQIRQALEPITSQFRYQSPLRAPETLAAAIELMETWPGKKLSAFFKQLSSHLWELLAPLVWLQETLMPWRKKLPSKLEAWIIASWQLALCQLEDFPPVWRNTASAIWDTLALFHRCSSLAESLHSCLRPYLSIHRDMPDWLLSLLHRSR